MKAETKKIIRTLTCTRSSLTTACGGLKKSTFLRSRPERAGVEAGVVEAAAGFADAFFFVDAGAGFFAVEGGGAAAAAGAAASSGAAAGAPSVSAAAGACCSAGASSMGSSPAISSRNGKKERND